MSNPTAHQPHQGHGTGVRMSRPGVRRELIETGSIADHDHLVTVLAANDLLVAA